jgi:hypothetical protein
VDEFVYYPPRRAGVIFQSAAILALTLIGLACLWQASQAEVGPIFLAYTLPALLAVGLVPFLIYRIYALQVASYRIEREGICLRWGLRMEDIPIERVRYVGTAENLDVPLLKPLIRWPGAVLGIRSLADGEKIEFLAARASGLILIITDSSGYAISPAQPQAFMSAYHKIAELGIIDSLPARSVYPAFLISSSWEDRLVRWSIMGGLLLCFSLFIGAILAMPGREQVAIRLNSQGTGVEYVPTVRLLLLPIMNFFFYIADAFLGIFFYRREESRPLAYTLWGSSIFASLLFWAGVVFILRAG